MAEANKTVSAVLETTSKSYLVESGSNEYGWWRRYSDGWVKQGGYVDRAGTGSYEVIFPIEFANTNYSPRFGAKSSTQLFNIAAVVTYETKETTKMSMLIGSALVGSEWFAEGLAV